VREGVNVCISARHENEIEETVSAIAESAKDEQAAWWRT
jgi:hypothetical protein